MNAAYRSPSTPTSFVLSAVPRWVVGMVTVLVWLAAGACVAYWVMRGLGQGSATPVPVAPAAAVAVDSQAVARALGARALVQNTALAAPVQADAASRYAVLGVVAPANAGSSGSGVALIAVEGQRAAPYRVGAVLDERWVVRSVGRTAVELSAQIAPSSVGAAPAVLTLTVPQRAMTATNP